MDYVYLDNNATTKPLPEVRTAVEEALDKYFANPASQHELGIATRSVIEKARQSAMTFIGAAAPSEITFSSGATVAISQAFEMAVPSLRSGQIVTSTVEHAATLRVVEKWRAEGYCVHHVPVNEMGELDLRALARLVKTEASFVSVSLVNNETGIIADIDEIGNICAAAGAILHVDAAQAAGRVALDVDRFQCAYMSLSPHKFHGPKGTGVLYSRGESNSHAESFGGTANVPGILGTAAAISAISDWSELLADISKLRDRLERAVLSAIPHSAINGSTISRVVNTSNIFFPSRSAADLVEALSRRGIFVSAGAACSGAGKPSHVIQAMGHSIDRANGSVRFSLSRLTTEREIDLAIRGILDVYSSTLPVREYT